MFCSKYKEKLRNVEDKISHIENVELRNIRIEIAGVTQVTAKHILEYTLKLNERIEELERENKSILEQLKTTSGRTEVHGEPIEIKDWDFKAFCDNLSVRITHRFRCHDIKTMEDLLSKSEKELLKLDGIGRKSVDSIKENLEKMGLSLAE